MPMLKWANELLSSTTEDERDEMQGLFDTAYWTKNANHQLYPDTEIPLVPRLLKVTASIQRAVFARVKNGKWLVELKME
jgi:hypothetical protein